MIAKYKQCPECQNWYGRDGFRFDAKGEDYFYIVCNDCKRIISANKRDAYIMSKYKMVPRLYRELMKKQMNRCGICFSLFNTRRTKEAHIDHDHETGKVRGLLCSRCNVGLGMLQDDVQLLENAAQYLRERK